MDKRNFGLSARLKLRLAGKISRGVDKGMRMSTPPPEVSVAYGVQTDKEVAVPTYVEVVSQSGGGCIELCVKTNLYVKR